MNREYLKYAITLCGVAVACLFAGIMVEHWGFEAIAGILIITSYVLLFLLPEPKKKTPSEKPSIEKPTEKST